MTMGNAEESMALCRAYDQRRRRTDMHVHRAVVMVGFEESAACTEIRQRIDPPKTRQSEDPSSYLLDLVIEIAFALFVNKEVKLIMIFINAPIDVHQQRLCATANHRPDNMKHSSRIHESFSCLTIPFDFYDNE